MRLSTAALAVAVISATACTGGLTAKSGGEVEPQVLSLVLAEGREVPYAPAVLHFARTVHDRSGGTLAVEVDWDYGRIEPLDGEALLITAVRDGDADLSQVPARTFDLVGIDVFTALQDPLTLDTLEKADAVATDEVGDRMLADLRSEGLVGLGMYTENLRRPVGYRTALTSVEDFAGLTMRAQPSSTSYDLLRALGADPVMSQGYSVTSDGVPFVAAESTWGTGSGQSAFPPAARITGDLVLFPKYEVFIANPAVFDTLTPDERDVLVFAARDAMRVWVEEHRSSEEELAEAWCADGRRLVMAGPEGVASVRAALRPVVEDLEADPDIRDDLAEVRRVAARHAGSFEAPELCRPPTGDGVWLDD